MVEETEESPPRNSRLGHCTFTRSEPWPAASALPFFSAGIIGTGSKTALSSGYLVGAALMIIGAIVEAFLGVDAERKSLEHVAPPLSGKL